jgi:hypothetical protein
MYALFALHVCFSLNLTEFPFSPVRPTSFDNNDYDHDDHGRGNERKNVPSSKLN